MNISFIILAYNDSNTLHSLIRELDSVLQDQFDEYEIIAVDDLSQDDTRKVLESLKSQYSRLQIKFNDQNMNVGGAFKEAVSICKYEYIGYTDGDFQYDMKDLINYRSYLPQYDVVTGYRRNRRDSIYRKLVTSFFNYSVSSLFNLDLKDVNSGLKIYNAQKLKALQTWDSGASYDLEILLRLKQEQNARIKEVRINHKPRKFGKAGGVSSQNIINIINCMLHDFSRYQKKSFKNFLIKKSLLTYLYLTKLSS